MALFGSSYMLGLIHIPLLFSLCFAADPFANFQLELSYITVSPLGVPQQVIAVNGTFPGPTLNVTTNYNVVVNVKNKLDENLLITWPGVQMRRNSWQDGVLGTNCPIPAGWNWTYQFQVKDQIGSFFYYPSLNLQRASGGFGSFIITNRDIIPIPFKMPDGDIVIIIGDWYIRNHTALRTALDAGNDLGMPDGVLINGKGPYQYNTTLVPGGIDYETINVDPGKTYRIRVHNVGERQAGPLPDPPNDFYDTSYVVNQAMSIRQNGSASGARPNPQGSFHYGSINITDTYILRSMPPVVINGKTRATFNGISFANPDTPIRLADQYKVQGAYKLDFPSAPLTGPPRVDRSVINATYKGFIEVILQNNDTVPQSFHMDGYGFFVVGMAYGNWTENSRNTYDKWDAITRSTVQVFPGAWTAVLVSLDNVGVWNLRAENLDRWYLGQETYMRIVNPKEDNTTEFPAPSNVLYCGALAHLQTPQQVSSSASTVSGQPRLYLMLLVVFSAAILVLR
ncbi:hypothetical protein Vadar_000519 [Vaccinium darrowii]|uniref:Uncharacterized protein n=1 Tax=Vaccinium darrowii TaxID=229202 RepID=A0ACB7YIL1_9ERIC|nr:hypothetical protein Vadar_000519 [Vaccinium darrowii]